MNEDNEARMLDLVNGDQLMYIVDLDSLNDLTK